MIQIRVNPLPERYLPLFVAAGEEVGLPYAVKPDFRRYNAMIDSGDYLFVGAENDGEPVGYIGVLFVQDLFNPTVLHAIVDSFYVMEEYRRTTVAGKLLGKVMPTVKAVAYDIVFQCKDGTPLAQSLASRGFRVIDWNFCKRTGEM